MRLEGRTIGLGRRDIRSLERLGRRKIPPAEMVSQALAREMAALSSAIGRRTGVLADRRGRIIAVAVGDAQRIAVPDPGRGREGEGRLRGVRFITTRLSGGAIARGELTELLRLRLDALVQIDVDERGEPAWIRAAHVLPGPAGGEPVRLLEPVRPSAIPGDFEALVLALEDELDRVAQATREVRDRERVILVIPAAGGDDPGAVTADLRDLVATAGSEVVDVLVQRRATPHPRTLVGPGFLDRVAERLLRLQADAVVFARDLSPSQARAIAERLDTTVLDRTRVILDIFARHAKSAEGKLRVELARLRHLLPWLAAGGTGPSRVRGGIGGQRGRGESKLELDRRKVTGRIEDLERRLAHLAGRGVVRRRRRRRAGVPAIAIVGYTNAGKSTLLNTLASAGVTVRDQLFSTLDTTTRRVRLPGGGAAVVTDTVGFIRDMPADLEHAFRSTLDELHEADVLIHVADASDPRVFAQIEDVRTRLCEMGLAGVPEILVFTRRDRIDADAFLPLARMRGGRLIAATDPAGAAEVLAAAADALPGRRSTEDWERSDDPAPA